MKPRSGPTDWSIRLEAETPELLAFLSMLAGSRELAEELFQDTCLEAWRGRRRFRPEGDLGAWLRGIARVVVLRHRRASARRAAMIIPFSPTLIDELADQWERRRSGLRQDARRQALTDCLAALDERQRDLLSRRYDDHERIEVIAAETERSIDAVKMVLHRLRRKLSDCMSKRLETEG